MRRSRGNPVTTFTLLVLMASICVVFQTNHPDAMASQPLIEAKNVKSAPDGLTASDWSSIRAAFEANRHAAFAVEGGYQSRNTSQSWRTKFDGRGFETTPKSDEWSWGLELVGFGRAGDERSLTAPISVEADNNRVLYQWSAELTEWFVNDRRGLEHGFTVYARPVGGVESVARKCEKIISNHLDDPLRLTIAVRGGLSPRVSANGQDVSFVDGTGIEVVNYNGLTVYDADGQEIPACFETIAEGLRLSVYDENARYPITIDPIAQQAYLKASNSGADDEFGYSVSVSGDTVVVGALLESSDANGDPTDNSAADSGAVYVFVRNGTTWVQQAYLKASNAQARDSFGSAVSIWGDTLVIGAPGEDSNATGTNGDQSNNNADGSGAAYVFVRNGTVWSQQAYLKASNSGQFDRFGSSVAARNGRVLVGAPGEDSASTGVNGGQANNDGPGSGAAYVFRRNGDVWSQEAYLKASNTGTFDWFGTAVAMASGNTVVVGACTEDSSSTGVNGDQANDDAIAAGAAYVFVRNGTTWSQQAYLKASNTDEGDEFGRSVAANGDTIVVGADREASNATGVDGNQDNNSTPLAGAAYVFTRGGTNWSQQAYLKASNTNVSDFFGVSVAVSGDTVVVGATEEDSDADSSGAAYVFVRDETTWSQQSFLKASNPEGGDYFGHSVAVNGGTMAVGARWEDNYAAGVDCNDAGGGVIGPGMDSGAVYIFETVVDSDGDGVPDAIDVCPDTSAELPVDENGQPLYDCNGDCAYDGLDLQCLVDALLVQ